MKLEIQITVTLDPKQMELILKAIKEKTTILDKEASA